MKPARLTADPAITYIRGSIEEYAPEPRSFDLVGSSLALHYVADYPADAMRVFDALRPRGRFAFSVEHPIVPPIRRAGSRTATAKHCTGRSTTTNRKGGVR